MGDQNRIVAVLACRINSSRLFAKPMQRVGDQSILDHLIACLRTSERLDDICLAVSDQPGNELFFDYADRNGLLAVVGSDSDVLSRLIVGADHAGAGTILRVTPDNPFIYSPGLDALLASHEEQNADISYITHLPIGCHYEIVRVAALKDAHERGGAPYHNELCTKFLFDKKEEFRHNPKRAASHLERSSLRMTVDHPEDLVFMNRLIARIPGEEVDHWNIVEQAVSAFDDSPDLHEINNMHHTLKLWS